VVTISDFANGSDKIALDHSIFSAAGGVGPLDAAMFYSGTQAHDVTDRIVYNASNGNVMYDADGSGEAAAITFAIVSVGVTLTENDLLLI
jgi:cysteinyl-tRNA synthetase